MRGVNLELFMARRLLRGGTETTVSVPIVRIALVGIALGVCVMLLSIFIVTGFKKEITDKITGFSSHLNVVSYGNQNAYGEGMIRITDSLWTGIREVEGISYSYPYVNKPAILKSKKEIHGTVFYGVDTAYRSVFFQNNLKEGKIPDFSGERASDSILISAVVADFLDVKTGDKIRAHFVQDPPRVRIFTVGGIYDTGFKEYDDIYALCDIRHLQRLNGWKENEVSGLAIELEELDQVQKVQQQLEEGIPWDDARDYYKVNTLYDTAPQLFEWLELLNTNIWVILILIVIVAGFNMVSGLLILILDKTMFIGVLKALGYRNIKLRRLFLYLSAGLIGRGIWWGNVLAIGLAVLQYYFRIVHLDPSTYYMSAVPVNFCWGYLILLNLGVLMVSTLMLVVPTMLISRISPVKAMQFE